MSYVTDIIEEDGARELDGGEVDGADLGGEDSLPHRHRGHPRHGAAPRVSRVCSHGTDIIIGILVTCGWII